MYVTQNALSPVPWDIASSSSAPSHILTSPSEPQVKIYLVSKKKINFNTFTTDYFYSQNNNEWKFKQIPFQQTAEIGFHTWCTIPWLIKLLTFLYRHSIHLLILRCERIATANRTALSSLPPCLISAPKMSYRMTTPIIFL